MIKENVLVQRIKEVCEDKDILISKLEKDLEFSSGLISRWDKSSPSVDRVVAVASYLQTSTDYLLGLKDSDTNNLLKTKFISTLLTRTKNLEMQWKKCEEGLIFNQNGFRDSCYRLFKKFAYVSYYDTFYFIFNDMNIFLNKCFHTKDVEDPCDYILFIEFDKNKTEDESNYSILSYDTEEIKPIYDSILTCIDNMDTAIKEKQFIEAFISNDIIKPNGINNNWRDFIVEYEQLKDKDKLLKYLGNSMMTPSGTKITINKEH